MSITIKPVSIQKQKREFVKCPAKLHRNHSGWVPGIIKDDLNYLDPVQNRYLSHSDIVLYLAYQDGDIVGRIMGIINHRANQVRGEQLARFALLESTDNREVVAQLLGAVETWGHQKGMTVLVGPKGFSNLDPQGLLIEGFEREPTTSSYYNFAYLPQLIEACGYAKDVDYVNYYIHAPHEIPEVYQKIRQRFAKRQQFRLIEFDNKKELVPYIRPLFQMMNDAYRNIHGYVPIDDQEIGHIINKFMPVIQPQFVKIVKKDDELVAFILGIPNLNEGLRKARGRLYPFGVWHVLRAMKTTRQLDLLLGAVREEYRGRGLDVLMGIAMIDSARQAGIEHIDSNQELETNYKVRAEMERVGGEVCKRSRIYRKEI